MESIPDDIWYDILRMGIETGRLGHTDLCSLAIVNRHFDQLTMHSSHWADLISRDFPCSFSLQAPSKDLYRKKHECRINRLNHSSFVNLLGPLDDLRKYRYLYHPLDDLRKYKYLDDPPSETEEDAVHQIEPDDISADGTEDVLSLESYVGRPVTRRERKRSYENKPSKSSRPKVIPNSKSYVPMNRPPRRSMLRKV